MEGYSGRIVYMGKLLSIDMYCFKHKRKIINIHKPSTTKYKHHLYVIQETRLEDEIKDIKFGIFRPLLAAEKFLALRVYQVIEQCRYNICSVSTSCVAHPAFVKASSIVIRVHLGVSDCSCLVDAHEVEMLGNSANTFE